METVICNEINKYRYLLHRIGRKECIARIQIYEHKCEQSANRSVQFLQFIKNVRLPQKKDTLHLTQHSQFTVTQEISLGELIKLLSKVQTTEGGKRRLNVGTKLTLMASPV